MKRRKARHYTTTFKEKTVELSYVRGNVKQISQELYIPLRFFIVGVKNKRAMAKTVFQVKGNQS